MNWEIVGALAGSLGAIAVIASLVYLAVQLRQQNTIAEFNAAQSVFQEFNLLNSIYLEDPSMIQVLRKGMGDPNGLSDEDAGRFQFLIRKYFNTVQMAYRAYQAGLLSEEDWIEIAKHFAADMESPGGKEWRETNTGTFVEFFNEIDRFKKSGLVSDYFMGRNA